MRLHTTPLPTAATRVLPRPLPPGVPLHQRVAAARIAGPGALLALMVERMAKADLGAAVTADDLARDGFTAAEIIEFAPAAARRAGEKLARREAARAIGRAA